MKSVTTARFRKTFETLPVDLQQRAKLIYQKWKLNPHHPSLHFKLINEKPSIYSVRISLSYRALAIQENDTMIWFWIGSHEEYNNLIKNF